MDRAGRRSDYYQSIGYRPHYYGRHAYFSDQDYRVFDERQVHHHEPREPEPPQGDDLDHPSES